MKKILIIDDNIDILEMLTEVLVPKGYQIITCNRPENVIEKIEKIQPDLIISDINMPKLTGRDIIILLKKHNMNIPIVILSAKVGMKDDIEFKLSKNIKAFLEKPCPLNKIVKTIEELLPSKSISSDTLFQGNYEKLIDKEIGNCKIKEFIGKGGTGIVYKGVHNILKKTVAIKILSPKHYNDEETIQRFFRECRILASFSHPNIINILNANKEDDLYYLIMEYIEGDSLLNIIYKEGYLPWKRAINIIIKVAEGLKVAHRNNILHRDIKPSNILISHNDEIVKIIDFGLAKKIDRLEENITKRGFVLGTPGYMAPEQCLDEKIDNRTDIYSLGITFYISITGRLPFEGEGVARIISQLKGKYPPPHLVNPDIPFELSKIVCKMIEREPRKRYPSIEEFIKDIKLFKRNNNSKKIKKIEF